jgi:hypothetical protein
MRETSSTIIAKGNMLVLVSSLLVFANGLFWVIFRRRLDANLPHVENTTRRTMSAGGYWNFLRLGVVGMILGAAGVGIYFVWFRD